MSREHLWLHTIYSLYLRSAFWFLYPDDQGEIAEIWPMPFTRVRPLPDMSPNPERLLAGYIYTFSSGEERTVPAGNVVWLRFPDPFDHYSALPPLRAASRPTILDNAQSDWNTNLFDENKGLPASIVSVPPELTDGEYNRVKAELKENVGKRMVTRGGTISVEFAQESHKEMEFLGGREFNEREIYETLGVPTSTDKESHRWFLDNTIWPVLSMLAGQITTQLVRPYFGDNIFAEFEDIRPQDRSLEVQEATQYWPSLSVNETREQRGLKPFKPLRIEAEIEGLQGLDLWNDVPTRLLDKLADAIISHKAKEETPPQLDPSINPEGTSGQGFAAPPSLPGSAGAAHAQEQEDREAADVADVAEETGIEEPENTTKAVGDPDALIQAAFDRWRDVAIKKMSRGKSPAHVYLDKWLSEAESYELAAVLGNCRSEAEVKAVFDHLDEYGNLKATLAGRGGDIPKVQLDLEDEFIGPMREWLAGQAGRIAQAVGPGGALPPASFWQNEATLLAAFLTPYVDRWGAQGISETVIRLADSGLGLDAGVNARAAAWAGKHALEMARGLNDTTRELARAKIKQWLQTGKPLPELTKSLEEIIAPPWRASLIASTEVTRAFSAASLEIAAEVDVIKRVVWHTAHDELVCPVCAPLNGATAKVGGVFPGGLSAPPAHPRCRCGLSFST
jgi:SPP1 gp7 family putative phage head morphogenesis protein